MKLPARTRTTLAAVFALTVLPAGAAGAQQADCVVVDGPGSAVGDVDCPDERGPDGGTDEDSGVGGETDEDAGVGGESVTRPDADETEDEVEVLPGRIDRPVGAPDGGDTDTEQAPAVESASEDELAATGAPAETLAVVALGALTLGGGAIAASRRRQRSES